MRDKDKEVLKGEANTIRLSLERLIFERLSLERLSLERIRLI